MLSGLVGALLAAGLDGRDAASAGAYLHGLAGRFAPGPPGASDVADALSARLAGPAGGRDAPGRQSPSAERFSKKWSAYGSSWYGAISTYP